MKLVIGNKRLAGKQFAISFLILGSILLAGCGPKKPQTETPPAEPTSVPTKPIETSVKEGPFVSLIPTADGHWVELQTKGIKKSTTSLEYELTYFADVEGSKIERGVTSGSTPVELNGATEFSKKILFGSASCTTGTCKYKYDEKVNEGMLTIKLTTSQGVDKYSSAFRIQKGKEAKVGLTTGDGVFSFVSQSLAVNSLFLTVSSMGVPSPLPENMTAKSSPYGIFPSTTTKGTVSFKTSLVEGKILLWDGQKWQVLETTVSNGIASAPTSKAGIFVLAE